MVKQLYDWSRQEAPGNAKTGIMVGYVYTSAVLQMPPIDSFITMPVVALLIAAPECLAAGHYCSIVFVMIMSTIQNREEAWPAIYAN